VSSGGTKGKYFAVSRKHCGVPRGDFLSCSETLVPVKYIKTRELTSTLPASRDRMPLAFVLHVAEVRALDSAARPAIDKIGLRVRIYDTDGRRSAN
jgi:hypothetical protein